jgi:hypothetical protein
MAKAEDSNVKRIGEAEERRLKGASLPDLDPLIRASNKLLEGWMAVGNEMLEFGKNRIDQSLELSKAMAQSTSLKEAMDLQAKYTRSIVQDCLSEANKIADLSTRSLVDSLASWQSSDRAAVERAEAAE